MSTRKPTKPDSKHDESDPAWKDDDLLDPSLSLEADWDPEMFTPEDEEDDTFDAWEITVDDSLLDDTNWDEKADDVATEIDDDVPQLEFSEDWTDETNPAAGLEGVVVLPWQTTGRFDGSEKSYCVHLDPASAQSLWVGPTDPGDTEESRVLWVQGVRFNVQFRFVAGKDEVLRLGRDALTQRVLISIPKEH